MLGKLLEKANNTVEQGRYFEQVAAFFLRNDPIYKSQFTKIYTWAEWRANKNESQNDIGIDLVAEELDGDTKNIGRYKQNATRKVLRLARKT